MSALPATDPDRLVATKAPDGVQAMFHTIAPTYDLLNHVFSGGIDTWWRALTARTLLRAGDVDYPRRVLDLCAGTGDLALAIHRRARRLAPGQAPPVIMTSDFTPRMVALAAPKYRAAAQSGKSSGPGPAPSVGDALRLPFADSAFDLATVAFGIRNTSDHRACLAEMVRVTRPGGIIAVLEFSRMKAPLLQRGFDFYFSRVLPSVGAFLTRTPAYRYLAKSVKGFPDTPEFSAHMAEAAGAPVTARRLTFGIATLYTAKVGKQLTAGARRREGPE